MGAEQERSERIALQKYRFARGLDKLRVLAKAEYDEEALMEKAAAALEAVFPHDLLYCGTVDSDTYVVNRFYGTNRPPNLFARIYENEYMENDFNQFIALTHRSPSVGILSRETGGLPERSVRYRELYLKRLGMAHEMRAALMVGRRMTGFITLLRPLSASDFTAAEGRFLSSFSAVLEESLRAAMLRRLHSGIAAEESGTGLIVLGSDMNVEAVNAVGERWLAEMNERFAPLVRSLAALLELKNEAGSGRLAPFTPRARLYAADGRWVTVEASTLYGRSGARQMSLVIEGLRANQLHSLIYAAYGFTDRERELLSCVFRGCSTRQIADELGISVYTVQDYFKSIFDKTGVRSRRDLIGKLALDRL